MATSGLTAIIQKYGWHPLICPATDKPDAYDFFPIKVYYAMVAEFNRRGRESPGEFHFAVRERKVRGVNEKTSISYASVPFLRRRLRQMGEIGFMDELIPDIGSACCTEVISRKHKPIKYNFCFVHEENLGQLIEQAAKGHIEVYYTHCVPEIRRTAKTSAPESEISEEEIDDALDSNGVFPVRGDNGRFRKRVPVKRQARILSHARKIKSCSMSPSLFDLPGEPDSKQG